jgi:hypothetical protein
MKCLAKAPEDRPRSAQELGRLLDSTSCAYAWRREEASRWWQTHLPVSAPERAAANSKPSGAVVAASR